MPTFVFIKRTFKKHPRFAKYSLQPISPFFPCFPYFLSGGPTSAYIVHTRIGTCARILFIFFPKNRRVYIEGGIPSSLYLYYRRFFIFPYKFLGTFLPAYNLCLTLRVNIN